MDLVNLLTILCGGLMSVLLGLVAWIGRRVFVQLDVMGKEISNLAVNLARIAGIVDVKH